MKNWLFKCANRKIIKIAFSDKERIINNINRLSNLKSQVHDLSFFVASSQSGGFFALNKLLDDQVVRGRPLIYNELKKAQYGENNQKIALDAPHVFASIMNQTENIIDMEIGQEKVELRKLVKGE